MILEVRLVGVLKRAGCGLRAWCLMPRSLLSESCNGSRANVAWVACGRHALLQERSNQKLCRIILQNTMCLRWGTFGDAKLYLAGGLKKFLHLGREVTMTIITGACASRRTSERQPRICQTPEDERVVKRRVAFLNLGRPRLCAHAV